MWLIYKWMFVWSIFTIYNASLKLVCNCIDTWWVIYFPDVRAEKWQPARVSWFLDFRQFQIWLGCQAFQIKILTPCGQKCNTGVYLAEAFLFGSGFVLRAFFFGGVLRARGVLAAVVFPGCTRINEKFQIPGERFGIWLPQRPGSGHVVAPDLVGGWSNFVRMYWSSKDVEMVIQLIKIWLGPQERKDMDRFDRLGSYTCCAVFASAAILGRHLSSRLSFAEHFVSQEGQLIDELSVPDTSAGASLSNREYLLYNSNVAKGSNPLTALYMAAPCWSHWEQ